MSGLGRGKHIFKTSAFNLTGNYSGTQSDTELSQRFTEKNKTYDEILCVSLCSNRQPE